MPLGRLFLPLHLKPRVVVNAEFTPKLSNEGVVNFLSAGYCFGDLTLFEGVKSLEPSTLLSLKLSNLATQKRQLWRIVYEPAPELGKRRVAEEALSQAMIEAWDECFVMYHHMLRCSSRVAGIRGVFLRPCKRFIGPLPGAGLGTAR